MSSQNFVATMLLVVSTAWPSAYGCSLSYDYSRDPNSVYLLASGIE